MTTSAYPDALGPLEILAPNLDTPLPIRATVRLLGCVTWEDDPQQSRARMRFPDGPFRAVSIDNAELLRTRTPRAVGLSNADLVRLDARADGIALEGLADAVSMGAGYYAERAVPNKPIKYIANVGTHTISVRPPLSPLTDRYRAGVFENTYTLAPGSTIRAIWDHGSNAYRILGGGSFAAAPPDALIADDDGETLVFDGDADYLIIG